MPILTGLAPDPRHPDHRVVEVDRGRLASLPAEELGGLDLEVGAELSAAVLERLQELADIEAAYRAAMRSLALRPRASMDLRRRLLQKPHPPGAVDVAMQRLAAHGLLDDLQFAVHFAATRGARGRGPARLLRDLLAQGVDRRTAEAGIERAFADQGIDPLAAVRRLATRRAGQLEGVPVPARRRRLLAFLARRGYTGSQVIDLVQELVRVS